MNLYVLQVIYKWLSIVFVSLMSFFRIGNYKDNNILITNVNQEKNVDVISTVTHYETEYIYNPKMPYNLSKVIKPGVLGVSYFDNGETHVVESVQNEIVEVGTGSYGLFEGKLTGYSAYCAGCSKLGNVACLTSDKKKHSLITDGIYYDDSEYGKIRILSTAKYFPCGTIIKVINKNFNSFYAIVLDRGSSMNTAWQNGKVWMDLAYESNNMTKTDGLIGNDIEFSVQRWGW